LEDKNEKIEVKDEKCINGETVKAEKNDSPSEFHHVGPPKLSMSELM
jgi:hypothetical protein